MIRRWIAKIFKLEVPPPPVVEPEHQYMGYTMTDEETGMMLSVLMICGCGNPVVAAGEDETNYWCEHCDRVCEEAKPCQFCESHMLFDAEAAKEEAAKFRYEEDE